MKIKLAIVFTLVFAISIRTLSAEDEAITDNTDIIPVSETLQMI